MSKKLACILGTAFVAVATLAAPAHHERERVFRGEIGDTQCAFNVHSLSQSHKEMMAMRPELLTAADCALFCVKRRGGRFVLQVKDKVYKLDNQDLAQQNAGLHVKLTGILDPKTDTIAVHSIEPLSPKPNSAPH